MTVEVEGKSSRGCSHTGALVITFWAPVYVTVEDGRVGRVRVNDEIDPAWERVGGGGPGFSPVRAVCADCGASFADGRSNAAARAALDGQSWPGWTLG